MESGLTPQQSCVALYVQDIIDLAASNGLNSSSGVGDNMSSIKPCSGLDSDQGHNMVSYVQAVTAIVYLQQAETIHPRVVEAIPTEFK